MRRAMPVDPEKLQWAKILTLIGGILQLVLGLLSALLLALVFGTSLFFLPTPGDIAVGVIFVFFALAILVSLVGGAIVTYAAFQYAGPNGRTWALVVTVLNGLAFFTGAGFFLGAIAALAGGILALIAYEGDRRPA